MQTEPQVSARKLLMLAALVGSMGISACNNDDAAPGEPTASASQTVLSLAASSSEVAEPFPVNDGAFSFDDTSEQTPPIPLAR
jgi:hypothetical protein